MNKTAAFIEIPFLKVQYIIKGKKSAETQNKPQNIK